MWVPFRAPGPAHPETADSTGVAPVNQLLSNHMSQPVSQVSAVPPYAVVRVQYEDLADDHEHVDYVETQDPDGGTTRWTAVQLIDAIRSGERFVLTIDGDAIGTTLEPAICPVCPFVALAHRSS